MFALFSDVGATVVSQAVPRILTSEPAANHKDRKAHAHEVYECYLDNDAHGDEPTIQNGYARKHNLAS